MNPAVELLADLVDGYNMTRDSDQLRWYSPPTSEPMGAVADITTPDSVVYRVQLTRLN